MNNTVVLNEKYYNINQLGKYNDFYQRLLGIDQSNLLYLYLDDLMGFVYLLTNDNNFFKHLDYYTLLRKEDGKICICGCDKCNDLYVICHNPTNICFGVGSSCIDRFFPQKMKSYKKKLMTDDICHICKVGLYLKTSKYYDKNTDKNKLGFCYKCWDA